MAITYYAQDTTNPTGGVDRFGLAATTDNGVVPAWDPLVNHQRGDYATFGGLTYIVNNTTNGFDGNPGNPDPVTSGAWSATDAANAPTVTFTNNLDTITSNTFFPWRARNTPINFWNRSFSRLDPALSFLTPAENGRHLNFWNCTLRLGAAQAAGTTTNIGTGWPNVDNTATTLAAGRTFNLYGCLVEINSGNAAAIIFDDLRDSDLIFFAGEGAGFYGATYSKTGATLSNSSIYVQRANATQFGEHTFRGVPSLVTNTVFIGTRIATPPSAGSPILLIAPDFRTPDIPTFFNTFIDSELAPGFAAGADNAYNIVGVYKWAEIEANMSITSPFASKLVWGGLTPTAPIVGFNNVFAQFRGLNPTVFSNVDQTTHAAGAYMYTRSNIGITPTGTTIPGRVNNTASATETIINRYLVNAAGKLVTDSYSLDGGTTFINGFFNYGLFNTSTTQNSSILHNTATQNLEDNTAALPIQITKKANLLHGGAVQPMVGQAEVASLYDMRGYAYTNNRAVSWLNNALTSTGANRVETPSLVDIPSTFVKSSNTVPASLQSGAAVTTTFTPLNNTVSPNDIHDAVRYMWSRYDIDAAPEVNNGIASIAPHPTESTTSSVLAGATTIPVQSTAGWPTSGQFTVSGLTVSYTGTTAYAFTGCSGITTTIAENSTITFNVAAALSEVRLRNLSTTAPFSFTRSTNLVVVKAQNIAAVAGEAVQGLATGVLELNGGTISGGSYVSLDTTDLMQIGNPQTFAGFQLNPTVNFSFRNAAFTNVNFEIPDGVAGRNVVFNNCTFTNCTIQRFGTGTLTVQGAGPGLSAHATGGVEFVTTLNVSRAACSCEVGSSPTHMGRVSLIAPNAASGAAGVEIAAATSGSFNATTRTWSYTFDSISSTALAAAGTYSIVYSGPGSTDTLVTQVVPVGGGEFNIVLTNSANAEDASVTVPPGLSFKLDTNGLVAPSTIGLTNGIIDVGIVNAYGANAPNQAQTNKFIQTQLRGTALYNRFVADTTPDGTTAVSRANLISQEGTQFAQVDGRYIKFSPGEAENQTLSYIQNTAPSAVVITNPLQRNYQPGSTGPVFYVNIDTDAVAGLSRAQTEAAVQTALIANDIATGPDVTSARNVIIGALS